MNRIRPTITPERALQLKAEAAQLKDTARIKQSAALAQIAQREGFRSWEELIGLAGGRDAVDQVKREQREIQSGERQPTEVQVRRAERRALFTGRTR